MKIQRLGRILAAAALPLALGLSPSVAIAQKPADSTSVYPQSFTFDTVFATVGSRASAGVPLATRAVQLLSADEIATTPANTLSDLLGTALGIDIQPRSAAQSDIAIRGSSFEQIVILVDGVRMNDAQTGHFALDLALPLAEIERIEVIRGPATAIYGSDAVGGVVQIVTRRGGSSIDASLSSGSFSTRAASFTAAAEGDRAAARVAAEYRRSDGHRPGTDDRALQTRAALDLRTGARTLRMDLADATRDFGARAFYTAPDAPYNEYEETRTTTATLAWLAPSDARLALEPRISLRNHEDDFQLQRHDPDFSRNRHTSRQLGGDLTLRYQHSDGVGFVLGGELFRDRLRSTSLGNREEDRGALFLEANAGVVGAATIALGLRSDWHSAFENFVAPSLAGAIWPAEDLRIRASLGRAFRAPTWTERYYIDPANIGDPDLSPERAWESELGAEYNPAPGLRIGIAGFIRSASGLIDWARPLSADPTDPWRTRNVSDARFRGLEADLDLIDPFGTRWSAQVASLSLRTEDTGGLSSKYALRPLTRTASLTARRDIIASLSISAAAFHARREGEPGYLRNDLRLSYLMGRGRLYLDLHNIADQSYLDVTGMRAPGRMLNLGVAWGSASR